MSSMMSLRHAARGTRPALHARALCSAPRSCSSSSRSNHDRVRTHATGPIAPPRSTPTPEPEKLPEPDLGLGYGLLAKLLNAWDNSSVPWFRMPVVFGLLYLVLRRTILNKYNLLAVTQPPDSEAGRRLKQKPRLEPSERPLVRTDDAYGNDLEYPIAGMKGAVIGRNMPGAPIARPGPETSPSPQLIAEKLLARRNGVLKSAAPQLNILAGAWIQAMIHDWQDHDQDLDKTVELSEGSGSSRCPLRSFKFNPTKRVAGDEDVFLNRRTGWWDASFVYGHSDAAVEKSRTNEGGKLRVEKDELLPVNADGVIEFGDQVNTWAGVAVLQDIFAREHNRICDEILKDDPTLSAKEDDEKVFQLARLAISGLVAKIHTVDWTVELLKTPTLLAGMRANWYGVKVFPFNLLYPGEKVGAPFGLVGSDADNHGTPFALTEEFTSVYRLHTMLPDKFPVAGKTVTLDQTFAVDGNKLLQEVGVEPVLTSMLEYPCGLLKIFNYPDTLRKLVETDTLGKPRPDIEVDLAALDIYRDRERGILKYNEFRRQIHMTPYKTWEDLVGTDDADHKDVVAALKEVYGADGIEKCDLQVGMLAEKRIPGFALPETSFHIFLLMASRRLQADRFLSEDFNEQVYGKVGFKVVQETKGMRDLLKRHRPELDRALYAGKVDEASVDGTWSAFKPLKPMPANL